MTNHKLVRPVCFICAGIFLMITAVIVVQTVRYSRYERVEATITRVWTESGKTSNVDADRHMVEYRYKVDGTFYTAQAQVFHLNGKAEGRTTVIAYDPASPSTIKNQMRYTTLILIDVALLAFVGSLIAIQVWKKR